MVQGSGRFAFIRGQGACSEPSEIRQMIFNFSILNEAIEQISFQAVKA